MPITEQEIKAEQRRKEFVKEKQRRITLGRAGKLPRQSQKLFDAIDAAGGFSDFEGPQLPKSGLGGRATLTPSPKGFAAELSAPTRPAPIDIQKNPFGIAPIRTPEPGVPPSPSALKRAKAGFGLGILRGDVENQANVLKSVYGNGNVRFEDGVFQVRDNELSDFFPIQQKGLQIQDVTQAQGSIAGFGNIAAGEAGGAALALEITKNPVAAAGGAGAGGVAAKELNRQIANFFFDAAIKAPSGEETLVDFGLGGAGEVGLPFVVKRYVAKPLGFGGLRKRAAANLRAKEAREFFGETIRVGNSEHPLLTAGETTGGHIINFLELVSRDPVFGAGPFTRQEAAQSQVIAEGLEGVRRSITSKPPIPSAKLAVATKLSQLEKVVESSSHALGTAFGTRQLSPVIRETAGLRASQLIDLAANNFKKIQDTVWDKFKEGTRIAEGANRAEPGVGVRVAFPKVRAMLKRLNKQKLMTDEVKAFSEDLFANHQGINDIDQARFLLEKADDMVSSTFGTGTLSQKQARTIAKLARDDLGDAIARFDKELGLSPSQGFKAQYEALNTLFEVGAKDFDRATGTMGLFRNNFISKMVNTAAKQGNTALTDMLFKADTSDVHRIRAFRQALDPSSLDKAAEVLRGTKLESDAVNVVKELKAAMPPNAFEDYQNLVMQRIINESMDDNGVLRGNLLKKTLNGLKEDVILEVFNPQKLDELNQLASAVSHQNLLDDIMGLKTNPTGEFVANELLGRMEKLGRARLNDALGKGLVDDLIAWSEVTVKNDFVDKLIQDSTDLSSGVLKAKRLSELVEKNAQRLEISLGKDNFDKFRNFARAGRAMQETQEPFGKWLIKLAQVRQTVHLARIGFGATLAGKGVTNEDKSTIFFGGVLLGGPWMIGKILTNPTATKFLLEGLKEAPKTTKAAQIAGRILAAYGIDQDKSSVFDDVDEIGQQPVPQRTGIALTREQELERTKASQAGFR